MIRLPFFAFALYINKLNKVPFKFFVVLNVALKVFYIPDLQFPREVKVVFIFLLG